MAYSSRAAAQILQISRRIEVDSTGQALNFNGGTLQLTGNINANLFTTATSIATNVGNGGAIIDLNGNNLTISNNLLASGSGGLSVNSTAGGGGLTLSGTNVFTGGLSVNQGACVSFTNDNQLGGAPSGSGGSIALNNGCLKSAGNVALAAKRTIALGGNVGYFSAGSSSTITINSQLTGSGGILGLNYDGNGIYVLTNSGNNYTGDTRIGTQGPDYWNSSAATATLQAGATNALPYGPGMGNVVVGYVPDNTASCPATLDLAGFSVNINGLTSNNPAYSFVNNSSGTAATLTLGNGNATATYGGTIENTVPAPGPRQDRQRRADALRRATPTAAARRSAAARCSWRTPPPWAAAA